MKKLITKYPVLNIILGVMLITLGVIAIFNQTLFEEGLNYLTAAFILIFTLIIFQRDIKSYRKPAPRNTLIIALLLTLMTITLLILWEPFTIAMSLGLILYLQGASHLLLFQFLRKAPNLGRFVLDLILVTFGAYLFFAEIPFEDIIKYTVIGLLILYGAILLYHGIHTLIKAHKLKGSEKPKEPDPIKEAKPQKPTQNHKTPNPYSKENLNKKTAPELKTMCKNRSMNGYSNLSKSQLVERLWRYEQEKASK